jgi:hypothetical protein
MDPCSTYTAVDSFDDSRLLVSLGSTWVELQMFSDCSCLGLSLDDAMGLSKALSDHVKRIREAQYGQ